MKGVVCDLILSPDISCGQWSQDTLYTVFSAHFRFFLFVSTLARKHENQEINAFSIRSDERLNVHVLNVSY